MTEKPPMTKQELNHIKAKHDRDAALNALRHRLRVELGLYEDESEYDGEDRFHPRPIKRVN